MKINNDSKIRYVFKNLTTDEITTLIYSLKEIEEGEADFTRNQLWNEGYSLISRDLCSGFKDRWKEIIFVGDIIELTNEDGEEIRVVCEFGSVKRDIYGNLVEIVGFYFRILPNGRKTFPIVNNYLGKHDIELFEIVGSIYETPDMAKGGELIGR